MRYYKIEVSDNSGKVIRAWNSHIKTPTGLRPNSGALNIEFELPLVDFASPMQGAALVIHNVGLQDVLQSSSFSDKTIAIYAGMEKGLPLADPRQNGLLVKGQIYNPFGNWQGTLQTLNFMILANAGSVINSKNITFKCPKGDNLTDHIAESIKAVYPDYTVTIKTKASLIANEDKVFHSNSLYEFAQNIQNISSALNPSEKYSGLKLILRENEFVVFDNETPGTPKAIKFQDMIGQPTWTAVSSIQTKTVLRADIRAGDFIELPKNAVRLSPKSFASLRKDSAQKNKFQVLSVRHFGNFRQRDGNSWATVIDATEAA